VIDLPDTIYCLKGGQSELLEINVEDNPPFTDISITVTLSSGDLSSGITLGDDVTMILTKDI